MRIISGKYKGRIIKMPKGIRPTQDKVRKALFDILGDIEGLSFLELFAGSGAVGLEAISRGVKESALVESNPDCIRAIKQNIESLEAKGCLLILQDTERAIGWFYKSGRFFDIIFLDPPYYEGLFPHPSRKLDKGGSGLADTSINDSLAKKTLQMLGAYDILARNGFMIVQHFKKDNLPDTAGDLRLFRQSRYGDTFLSFYRKDVPKSDLSR